MKDLQQFAGKRMPYKEDSDYVSSLLDRCADKALAAKGGRGGENVKAFWLRVSSAAAVIAVTLVMCFNLTRNSEFDNYKGSAPLADVIASMSDDQLMDIAAYELDEIPEYYE